MARKDKINKWTEMAAAKDCGNAAGGRSIQKMASVTFDGMKRSRHCTDRDVYAAKCIGS